MKKKYFTPSAMLLLSLLVVITFIGCGGSNKSGFQYAKGPDIGFGDSKKSDFQGGTGSGSDSKITPGKILFQDTFESGTWNNKWHPEKDPAASYAITIVSNPSGSGKVIRFELRKTDGIVEGSKRSELAMPAERNIPPSQQQFPQFGERWYAFKIFLPADYATDTSPEILAQWHNWPDQDLGEGWMSPPLALVTKNGNWQINRIWDTASVSSNDQVKSNNTKETIILGPYANDRGKWTSWVFHIKWGWFPEHNPKLEIYKNGTKVVERNGMPNTTNDVIAPYFKIGIYKWDWADPGATSNTTKRVVYFDSVKIGDENCRLVDVDP